jgi:hypothetical protein
MRLRPYQQAGIDKFLARPHPRRMFLSWEMGSGKTFAAIKAVIDLAPARALFIVPAVVRPMWSKLLAEYCPERALGSITMGRDTKTGSKATLARRDAAYAADWQIVSYDLVDEVALGPWELVVLDEVHNLRNPTTLTSKRVRALFEHNRDAAALGLSGTMIPNEAKNIWNPLHTFFPGEFGEPAKTGEVSWGFLNRYCFKESNGYGTRYFGLRPESRERLAAAVAPISHRVVTADFAGTFRRCSSSRYTPRRRPRTSRSSPSTGRTSNTKPRASASLPISAKPRARSPTAYPKDIHIYPYFSSSATAPSRSAPRCSKRPEMRKSVSWSVQLTL